MAAALGHWEIAVELVACGADVALKDDKHRRPADVAAGVQVNIDLRKMLRKE